MLDFMRRHATGWVVRVALGIVTLVFIFFMGGGGRLSGHPSSAALVTVGDQAVSAGEYEQTLRRMERNYREQFGDKLNSDLMKALDLPSQTLTQLVDAAALRSEAERLGLRVPDVAVREKIVSMPQFQREGQFSPALYRAAVQTNGMSPSGFESAMRRDMLVNQLVQVIRRGVHVSEDEAFRDWSRGNDKIVLSYVALPTDKFDDQVKVEEEALTKWFDEHAESYREPVAVRVRYLAYTPKAFAGQAPVTDEAIEEYYVLNEDEFKSEETVAARHILKKIDDGADDSAKAAARDAINKVKARLDAGEDFAKVAEEESQDEGSAKSGGDLGTFGRGKMVQPFEDAAFALQPGQTSDVVESQFGFHIIRVYEHNPGGTRPLAEVHDEIAAKITDKAAAERAFELAASDASDLTAKKTDLDKIAAERSLEVKTTDMISKGSIVADVGSNPAFVEAALGLVQQGETTEPVRIDDTYYVLQLQERRESQVPELAKVRDRVERDYRKEQARDLAERKASELVQSLEGGKTLDDIASAEGVEVKATEPFARQSGFISDLGAVRGLAEVAFKTKKDGDILPRPFVHEGNAYVFVRKSFVPADRAEFDKSKDSIISSARKTGEQAALSEFVRDLKQRMRVAYNQQLLDHYIKQ